MDILLSLNFYAAMQFKLEAHYVTVQRIVAVQLKQKEYFEFSHWIRQTITGNRAARLIKIISKGKQLKRQREYKEVWCTNLCTHKLLINVLAHGGNWRNTRPLCRCSICTRTDSFVALISAVLIWCLQRPSVANREHQLAQITGRTDQFSLVFIIISIMHCFFVTIKNGFKKLSRDK